MVFVYLFLFPFLPYNMAVTLCLLPQMPWRLFLTIRAWRRPFSVFIQWAHIYLVPVLHKALCGVGAVGLLRWWDNPCVRMYQSLPGSTCLAFSSIFTKFLNSSSCCFSSCIYLFHGSVFKHVFALWSSLIASPLIWPLFLINFLFFCQSAF